MKFKIDLGRYHPTNEAESKLYQYLLQFHDKYINQEELERLKKEIMDQPGQINKATGRQLLSDFKFNMLKSTGDQWIIGNGMRIMFNKQQ